MARRLMDAEKPCPVRGDCAPPSGSFLKAAKFEVGARALPRYPSLRLSIECQPSPRVRVGCPLPWGHTKGVPKFVTNPHGPTPEGWFVDFDGWPPSLRLRTLGRALWLCIYCYVRLCLPIVVRCERGVRIR
jgi:hypothetical protein